MQHRTIKIRTTTYRALKLRAAETGETMVDLLDRLLRQDRQTTDKETPMRRTFRYEVMPLDRLTATDLREIAAGAPVGAEAYRITIVENDRPAAEAAEALYLPDEGRLGIAWGADADWADVADIHVETAIGLWLNDADEWAARN